MVLFSFGGARLLTLVVFSESREKTDENCKDLSNSIPLLLRFLLFHTSELIGTPSTLAVKEGAEVEPQAFSSQPVVFFG